MANHNIGTLVTSAIRPNNELDPIATAYSSEIKGGFHSKNSISDRNSIITERREWGMICYVINVDRSFQLVKGYVDNDIDNNANWVDAYFREERQAPVPVYDRYTIDAEYKGVDGSGVKTNAFLSQEPSVNSRIEIFINGLREFISVNGETDVSCWFGEENTAIPLNVTQSKDYLIWNEQRSKYPLNIGDEILIVYEAYPTECEWLLVCDQQMPSTWDDDGCWDDDIIWVDVCS